MKHGNMDVEVSEPLMRVDNGSYTAEITYNIDEGEQYYGQIDRDCSLVDVLNKEGDCRGNLKLSKDKMVPNGYET